MSTTITTWHARTKSLSDADSDFFNSDQLEVEGEYTVGSPPDVTTYIDIAVYTTVYGNGGDDWISIQDFPQYGVEDIYVDGGPGNDLLHGVATGALSLYGGFGDDTLSGFAGADESSIFDGGPGYDSIQGTGFDDSIRTGYDGAYIDANAGDDEIYLEGGVSEVYGEDGNDNIFLNLTPVTRTPDPSYDNLAAVISGGDGVDRLTINHYGAGSLETFQIISIEELVVYASRVYASPGQLELFNSIQGDLFFEHVTAGATDLTGRIPGDPVNPETPPFDIIENNEPAQFYAAEDGANTFIVADSPIAWILRGSLEYGDTLTSGLGDDIIYARGGKDVIDGGGGADKLTGGFGNDTMDGGVDGDTLRGEFGFDSLLGGTGDDILSGDSGNDRLNGGDDNDTVSGGLGYDRLEGAAGNDLVMGEGGNDTLRGAGGSDTLDGGAGVDVIFGGSGADMADGGTGNDRIRSEAGNDTVNGGEGNDRAFGSFGYDSLSGDNGDDFLDGNGGNDTLIGGNGDDTLIGNFGFDSLRGGANNDSLEGSGGNDTVTGGGGDDTFLFALGDDRDVYTDFTAGAGTDDVIELSGFGASFDTFAEVFAAATQAGANVVIDFGGGDTITLFNTNVGDLHQDDFLFL